VGKRRSVVSRSVTLGSMSTLMLAPNGNRVAVVFTPDYAGGTAYYVSFGEQADDFKGVGVGPAIPPLVLTRELLGDAIMKAAYGIIGTGAPVAVLEVIETDD